ncbi:FAD/FMN-containing dehydrogenase [Saccharopolyspora lacisalsi]|uniref:FAD/FMN-containing dehydrogenase n=1 Tax=Halosaccharopolyspora lacisalsi TaxID=1000566 RepID=A0A839E886_9PSEU|nr:FAD/FMN-containing dehydrogenase [Halosaccharopolyspora lacisalsi]
MTAPAGEIRTLNGWGRTAPTRARQMYPRIDEWRKIRASVDPQGIFTSDMSRRLTL